MAEYSEAQLKSSSNKAPLVLFIGNWKLIRQLQPIRTLWPLDSCIF